MYFLFLINASIHYSEAKVNNAKQNVYIHVHVYLFLHYNLFLTKEENNVFYKHEAKILQPEVMQSYLVSRW